MKNNKKDYVKKIEYIDDHEMEEILNNDELLESLENGLEDVRKNRGKIVA